MPPPCMVHGQVYEYEESNLGLSGMAYVRNGDGANDGPLLQVPKAQSIISNDAETGLQDGKRNDVVRGKDDILIPVNGESMRIEVLS